MDQIVVWDSSVLIPLILTKSKSYHLYQRLHAAGWPVATTPTILNEVAQKLKSKETLKRWLGLDDAAIHEFVDIILPSLIRVYPGVVTIVGGVLADPDDDAILAAAVESNATYIISEDRHLLNLGFYGPIKIFDRDGFQQELDRLGVPRS